MKKGTVITGMGLDEIINNTQSLADHFGQFSTQINMPLHPGGSNQEDNNIHMSFQVGGWISKSDKEQINFSADRRRSITQGFGIIEVNVWAMWGGNYYDDEPIEDTVANILIVDRRTHCMDGSYVATNFEDAKKIVQRLLDNPKDRPLI